MTESPHSPASAEHTIASLAAFVGGKVIGAGDAAIDGVADLRMAGPRQIGFLRDSKLLELARGTGAGALLVSSDLQLDTTQVVVADPFAAFARIALLFHPVRTAQQHHIHPSAQVASDAVLHEPVEVEAGAVIEAGAQIGAGSVVGAGTVIGAGSRVGTDCMLYPRVVLYPGVTLGARVILHSGVVLGADGFGFAPDAGQWVKLPQIGTVDIGDDVEIGANSTVDSGTLGPTRVGRGCKIDNHVHIGHNCILGEDCAIAGFTALAGSVTVGDRVSMGGHVISNGHLSICDDARIGGVSVVSGDVREPGDYLGYPLQPKRVWIRTLHLIGRMVSDRSAGRR